jgi:hypothetical protein
MGLRTGVAKLRESCVTVSATVAVVRVLGLTVALAVSGLLARAGAVVAPRRSAGGAPLGGPRIRGSWTVRTALPRWCR